MATILKAVTSSWTKVVEAGDEFFLSPITPGDVDVAVTDDGNAPSIASGHRLSFFKLETGRESVNRAVIGPGTVYAKTVGVASASLALSAWTPV